MVSLLSDWADVAHLSDWHRVAKDTLEATRMAIEAGLDMAMIPNDYSFLRRSTPVGKRQYDQRIPDRCFGAADLTIEVGNGFVRLK